MTLTYTLNDKVCISVHSTMTVVTYTQIEDKTLVMRERYLSPVRDRSLIITLGGSANYPWEYA